TNISVGYTSFVYCTEKTSYLRFPYPLICIMSPIFAQGCLSSILSTPPFRFSGEVEFSALVPHPIVQPFVKHFRHILDRQVRRIYGRQSVNCPLINNRMYVATESFRCTANSYIV